ncbi:hypothetical protein HHK36_032444 [Tetracentron sinense]|uniref:Uncharacterized protein n=1 Tax=Tetracentron sinense TaxID=13715 RepID=A0A834Y5H6_TETSI|nr:hypothetical protein HHK36_032444 [Tetracentron sinense]
MRQNGATMPSGVKASLQQEVQPTSKIISKETLYICNFFHTIFNLISPFLSSSMLVSSSAGSSRMNHRNLFMFKVSFHVWIVITILTFLFLAETSLCVDPHFEACKRLQNCGTGPNISYPFWIHEQQEPFCGYPGFEISCKSGTPIIHNPLLNISDDDHVIHQIFYQNQSLRIANAEALDNTCLPSIHKVTLQGTPFNFGPAHANLLLYLNCTPIHLNESVTNRISCASDNETLRSLALFGDDPLLNYVNDTKICKASAVAPVDKYGNATFETRGYRDYIEFLRRGFLLTWKAPICNVCEESGGRCGFNTTTYNFACFCPDRPHLKRCNVVKISGDQKTIISIRDHEFTRFLRGNNCDDLSNFTKPFSPALSFELRSHNLKLSLCKGDPCSFTPEFFFNIGAQGYLDCGNHDPFFYSLSPVPSPAPAQFPEPDCEVVKFPVHDLPSEWKWIWQPGDLLSLLDVGFDLQWNLPRPYERNGNICSTSGLFMCAVCQVYLAPSEGISVHAGSIFSTSSKPWQDPFLCADCRNKKDAMEGKRPSGVKVV